MFSNGFARFSENCQSMGMNHFYGKPFGIAIAWELSTMLKPTSFSNLADSQFELWETE